MPDWGLCLVMARAYPERCLVFGVAPTVALLLQLTMALYHGFSLLWPATFALVVGVGMTLTFRQYLAQFQVERHYRTIDISQV